jgi:hypothetical protein
VKSTDKENSILDYLMKGIDNSKSNKVSSYNINEEMKKFNSELGKINKSKYKIK